MHTAIVEPHRTAVAGALLLVLAGIGRADVDVTLAIATDYLNRGLNQTLSGPAYQAAIEYHAEQGWFAGIWTSRVDFKPYDDRYGEIDYYLGFGRRLNRHVALESALIRYDYRGTATRDYDWEELQLTAYLADHWILTWGIADGWGATDKHSQVLEATLRYPLPGAITLDTTIGRQFTREAIGIDYNYGQIGLSRPLGDLVLRVAYAGSDDNIRDLLRPLTRERWVASLTWQP